jgi:inner membrane protein
MASFGHVAVGMLTGRLHGGGGKDGEAPEPGSEGTAKRRTCSWATLLLFAGLALLPDADVLLVSLGACDAGACGHRGASHSLPVAIAIGVLAGLVARALRWPVLRTVLATTVAVGSHALLDVLGAGGRGLPLLWPFSEARFISPVRIFPDAPRGLALLSWPGAINVAIEFAVFLPVMVLSVWPNIAGWLTARGLLRRIRVLPSLTFIEGGVEAAPAAAPAATAVAAPAPPTVSDEQDPAVRSAG